LLFSNLLIIIHYYTFRTVQQRIRNKKHRISKHKDAYRAT